MNRSHSTRPALPRWTRYAAALLMLGPAHAALAADAYTGGSPGTATAPVSGNFSTGFSPALSTSAANAVTFSVPTSYTATNDTTDIFSSFTFSGAATDATATIAGNTLIGQSTGTLTFTNNSAATIDITAPITYGTGEAIVFNGTGAGQMVVSGGVSSTSGNQFQLGSTAGNFASAGVLDSYTGTDANLVFSGGTETFGEMYSSVANGVVDFDGTTVNATTYGDNGNATAATTVFDNSTVNIVNPGIVSSNPRTIYGGAMTTVLMGSTTMTLSASTTGAKGQVAGVGSSFTIDSGSTLVDNGGPSGGYQFAIADANTLTSTLTLAGGTFDENVEVVDINNQAAAYAGVFTMNSGAAVLKNSLNVTTGAGGGTLNLNGGTLTTTGLTFNSGAGATGAATVNLNGGTLDFSGSTTVATPSNGSVVVGTGGASIGVANGQAVTFNPALTGSTNDGGLTVGADGSSGTLKLGGANTFTGAVNVDNGTLEVLAASSLGNGVATYVHGPGTLTLDAASALNSGEYLYLDGYSGTLPTVNLNFTGMDSIAGIYVNDPGTYELLDVTTGSPLTAATLNSDISSQFGGVYASNNIFAGVGNLSLTNSGIPSGGGTGGGTTNAVPEANSLALLALGLPLLGLRARRRGTAS